MGQRRPGGILAQVDDGVAQLGMADRQGAAGDRADALDRRVGQQAWKQAGAEVAGRAGQSNVDRTSSKARSAWVMWSSVWVAITDVRSRARPGATAGGMAQLV